jgi:hypothetical protein
MIELFTWYENPNLTHVHLIFIKWSKKIVNKEKTVRGFRISADDNEVRYGRFSASLPSLILTKNSSLISSEIKQTIIKKTFRNYK